jgi:two-component system response regulator RstA
VTTDQPASGRSLLIVEDDNRLSGLLSEFFATHGFRTGTEAHGERAVERIEKESPSLVILDVMLPGLGGFDVCRRVRPTYAGGILMLTASKAEVDEAVGLELGADDYVVKPVEPRILLARVRSLLRRLDGSSPSLQVPSDLTVGPLVIHRPSREVWVHGRQVDVTGTEFDVLWLLARRAGEVVTREEIYQHVRGIPYDGLDRGMDVHVSRLRHKLEHAGLPQTALKSVRSLGYLLVRR